MGKYLNKIGLKSIEQVVFFDVESATIVENLEEGTDLYESWKYKMRNEGFETYEQYNDSFKKNGPLYAPFAKVCSIVCGYVRDGKLVVKDYTGVDEAKLISDFFSDLGKLQQSGKRYLSGHSVIGYDCPLLSFRAMVHDLDINPWFDVAHQKEWNLEYIIDLHLYLKGTAFTSMSLINAAVAFGLPSPKQSMIGNEVSENYYKGNLDKIRDYCICDTQTAALILAKILKVKIEL